MKKIVKLFRSKWREHLIEIIVIIIGILLAFALNNWHQARQNSLEEARILKSISEKMEHNKFQKETAISRYQEVIDAAKAILTIIHNSPSNWNRDQLNGYLYSITKRFLVGKSNETTIYDELIGSDQLKFLTSEELRNSLTKLKTDLQLLASYEEIQYEFVDDYLSPFLNKNIDRLPIDALGANSNTSFYDDLIKSDLSNINLKDQKPLYQKLIDNNEFSNLLVELIKHTKTLMPIYKRMNENIEIIDSLIMTPN